MTDDDRNSIEFNLRIRGESSDGLPPEVEQRLRGRLEEFRACVEDSAPIYKQSGAESNRSQRTIWIFVAGLAACVLIVAIISLNLTRASAWADVVESVQKQPWIRYNRVGPDEPRMEFWFYSSKQKRTLALCFGDVDFASYVDFERREDLTYRKRDSTIVRRSLQNVSELDLGIAGDFLGTFAPHDELLKQLNKDSLLIDQSRKEVVEDGRHWIQYKLTFEETHGKREQFIDTYLIDIETNLPRWWIRSSPDGKRTLRFRIEYPESGPKNIFELGVPQATAIVDHATEGAVSPNVREHGK